MTRNTANPYTGPQKVEHPLYLVHHHNTRQDVLHLGTVIAESLWKTDCDHDYTKPVTRCLMSVSDLNVEVMRLMPEHFPLVSPAMPGQSYADDGTGTVSVLDSQTWTADQTPQYRLVYGRPDRSERLNANGPLAFFDLDTALQVAAASPLSGFAMWVEDAEGTRYDPN